ncbi:amino acid ABC transporter permease [Thalassospira xiamenensis]|uniref:Polar amino acid ABC transporter permease n=1 Tax=Thalassospira xiamenensis TaxID=220697 RepID=A0A367XHQ4_9PROT|nr:amino acid ABC transporter permease [Thalassospira xiamenensis]KZB57323.1 polar amino acid ABC transporter permease [Thalassospira xiamenensis]RCK52660.1 polar amino acid ABC transporter permease [Thalassospira xiamenensis]
MSEQDLKHFVPTPPRLPTTNEQNLLRRIQKQCFNSIGNSLLTISVLVLIYYVAKSFLDWAVFNAVWNAATRRECMDISPDGACWAGVIDWFNGLIYGRYPDEEQWRVNGGVIMGLLWLLPLMTRRIAYRNSILISWITLYPFLGAYMFLGGTFGQDVGIIHMVFTSLAAGYFILLYLNWMLCAAGQSSLPEMVTPLTSRLLRRGQYMNGFLLVWAVLSILCGVALAQVHLEPVPVDHWGGLFLTLIIASFAITMSIPVGILLALGRRSKLPVIHWLSMMLIELVRAVPLITVLFMAVTLLPIFLPSGTEPDKLSQVLFAVCLFAGAYMAENIRGGLQAIPDGQYEAAQTLGLGYWLTMGLIILPQAMRLMIPNIMTSFISMLKDTTLVSIIGLFDIMLMARNISNDKNWIGLHTEPLALISILFFVMCYGMSQYSLNLEKRLKAHRS